jgi:hypothetical protein
VAHSGVLRPDYRDHLWVRRFLGSKRSHLARPGCKRYHPPCNLQAQDLMHVQMALALAHADGPTNGRYDKILGLGGPT